MLCGAFGGSGEGECSIPCARGPGLISAHDLQGGAMGVDRASRSMEMPAMYVELDYHTHRALFEPLLMRPPSHISAADRRYVSSLDGTPGNFSVEGMEANVESTRECSKKPF